MTAPGTITETPKAISGGIDASAASALPLWRRVRKFGTGFGIAIANGDLEAVIVRSRPSGSAVVASAVIGNFATRPAAEWGAELLGFLRAAGEPHLAATIVLPREEVIVRTVRLPGVAEKDTASAIELQLDTLHPWDDTPIEWAWCRVTATDAVVGIVRQATLSEYETLFSEAGIPIAAVTFSSAVIHAALRLQYAAPASIFCYIAPAPGRLEVYGESDAKPCYSAGFALSQDRALAVARAELRLPPEHPAVDLSHALSAPSAPVAYGAALAASAPLLGHFANLLPAERRASHSRTRYLIPIALAALLVLAMIAVFVIFPILNERRYVADLTAEQRRLAPAALRVQTIDKTLATDRARIAALDDFRQRPQADLDVLNELVRLLPEQVWTNSIEIQPDNVVIAGEADQAAPLPKLLNSSALFEKSEFVMPFTHNGQADLFRIKAMRRGRAGRTTP
jgi:Tfp pilus assembly protein PilN